MGKLSGFARMLEESLTLEETTFLLMVRHVTMECEAGITLPYNPRANGTHSIFVSLDRVRHVIRQAFPYNTAVVVSSVMRYLKSICVKTTSLITQHISGKANTSPLRDP